MTRPRGTCWPCGWRRTSTATPWSLPAAGLPWFLTVFGRDTLITAYQSVSFGPQLARGALLELASLQGKECNDFKDEEPGQDPARDPAGRADPARAQAAQPVLRHRRRHDALAHPALRVLALDRRQRAGPAAGAQRPGRAGLDRPSTATATATGTWSTRPGRRRAWATSAGATRGTASSSPTAGCPYLPIATCELQGYVYDAKLRLAELADGPLGDPALAAAPAGRGGGSCKERFNRDFWIDERGGYYAIALDGDKRQVDSLTSNIGHLLWSGIVAEERVAVGGAPADVGRDVLRLGRPHAVHHGPRIQPDRLSHAARSGRTTTRSS